MKRLFTLSAICVAMLSLVGCDSKQKAINEWIKGEVDHFVALETESPTLYYIKNDNGRHLIRVDLDTFEARELCSFNNGEYIFNGGIGGYYFPEDKGWGESRSFVIAGNDYKKENDYSSSEDAVALRYDVITERTSEICRGEWISVVDDVIVNVITPNSYATSISQVDLYDVDANKLQTKTYVGTIAKQSVVVELVEHNGVLAGSYYYTKYGPGKARIALIGRVDENRNCTVEGYGHAYKSSHCETWEGTIKDGQICATFKAGSRTYEFTLTEQK